MKMLKLSLLAGAALLAIGSAAHAEDAPALKIALNLGGASDYEFRGISNTNNKVEVFGGADATYSIGYVGAWLSNVDFGNKTDAEYDLYGGVRPVLGPVTFDVGVIRYGYINQPKGSKETYYEFKGAGSVAVGPATIGAAVYYSDDFFGGTGKATYYELNASGAIPNTKFSVSGAVGRQEIVGPLDYTTWNAGVGYAVNEHIAFDLRYWDTDASKKVFGSNLYSGRGVISVKATF